jgi:hypothetical protein
MKIQVLAVIILVCGMLIGIGIGGSLFAVTNDTAGLNRQINDLNTQNMNKAHQIQVLENQTTAINSDKADLTWKISNMSDSLASAKHALLTPTVSLVFNRTSDNTYNVSVLSISNEGVPVDLVAMNVTPSAGVIIGPWSTQDQVLGKGDSFTISNLTLGNQYQVRISYKATGGEMAHYEITVPAPVGELMVTNVTDGVYNITLVSISPNDLNTSQVGLVLAESSEASYEGTLSAISPFHILRIGDYMLISNLLTPGEYTIRMFYIGNPQGSTIATITFSVPGTA